jgi:hypothetical protein
MVEPGIAVTSAKGAKASAMVMRATHRPIAALSR